MDREYTPKQLSRMCGVSSRAITNAAEKIGIEKKGGRWLFTEDEAEKLTSHYKSELKEETEEENEAIEEETEQTEEQTEETEEEKEQTEEENEAIEGTLQNQEALAAVVEILREQLRVKDEQIASLQRQQAQLIDSQKALVGNVSLLNASDKKELFIDKHMSRWEHLKAFFMG